MSISKRFVARFGLDNGNNTITGIGPNNSTLSLAGNLTTSGAYATTFTTSGTTSITLPTTGTLATLAGTETFTNKTLTTPTIDGASLSGTFSGTPTFSGNTTFSSGTTAFNTGSSAGTLNFNTDVTTGTVNLFSNTTGTINVGAANSTLVVNGNLTVNGTTTTINSSTINVDDITIELGAVASPTDTTANGGGIILKGATDKTILWDSANTNWTSSENWNLASGKVFKINNVDVLSSTTLGSGVTASSLTSVGTLTSGTWNASTIGIAYGGTGVTTTPTNGQLLVGNGSGYTLATLTNGTGISVTNASGSITIANTDRGSSQEIFKNFAVAGQTTVSATTNSDTLTLAAGTGITITTSGKTITIAGGLSSTSDAVADTNVARDSTGSSKFAKVQLVDSTSTPSTVVTDFDTVAISIVDSNTQVAIDSFSTSSFRSASYTIQISDGTDFHMTRVLVFWKGSNAYITEYGTIYSGSALTTLDADVSGGNVRLLATNASASGTFVYKVMRNTFAA
jgi:hypothetical protein